MIDGHGESQIETSHGDGLEVVKNEREASLD